MPGPFSKSAYGDMPDESGLIQPRAVPLTHAGHRAAAGRRNRPWLLYAVIAAAAAVVISLFTLVPALVTPVDLAPPTGEQVAADAAPSPARAAADQPPPFAAIQREQARAEASDELARFVELELRLRDALHVSEWGQNEYETARTLAQSGDEAFVADRFEVAIAAYREAADALAALVETGLQRFDDALAKATAAIDVRNPKEARRWLDRAKEIKPNDGTLLAAEARAERLPEVIDRLRQARNLELAGRWAEAVQALQEIRALDAQTSGIDAAIANARQNQAAQALATQLSVGFAALGRRDFAVATRAFNQALALDPGNSSALGGLQQIADQSVVIKIDRLKAQAAAHAAAEQWSQAAAAYQNILAVDANIRFAQEGLDQAEAQQQALDALAAMQADAQQLSADARYREALAALDRAKALEPQGPTLAAAIRLADVLLRYHGSPVAVLLRSDDATEVLLSNIGPLGRFSERRLELRPGAYRLLGSRDGCRDVRTQIVVKPDMAPVDIRCQEALQQ